MMESQADHRSWSPAGHQFDLTGIVAVVTGAGGLLGREHCIALAESRARVIAVDLDSAACEATVEQIRAAGYLSVEARRVDITARSEVTQLCEDLVTRFGYVGVLVNNAALNDKVEGRAPRGPVAFENFPLSEWQRTIDVNLTGMFLCCQVFGALMEQASRGSIINISSTYGMVGPDQRIYQDELGRQTLIKSPAYAVTKAGVLGLTRYLAAYYGPHGVRVNALSPGGVQTSQDAQFVKNYASRTPLGRMARPDEYRGAIVYLASNASSYVTGANIVVDGGWTAW